MDADGTAEDVSLHVENIGGIDETDVMFSPGVTILSGRNATNRTSLLRALMAVLGSDRTSVKGDAQEGTVAMEFRGETYRRTLQRQDGTVIADGHPYLDDSEEADLFAFLLGTNEARRAVERGEDLYEIIMRPVDTDAIDSEIEDLRHERERLDEALAAIDERKRALPDLEAEREQLREEIEQTREQLSAKEDELASAEAPADPTSAERARLETKLEELGETRRRLEDIRFDIETEDESIASVRQELRDLQAELDELPNSDTEVVQAVEPEIKRLREQVQRLKADLGDLQSTIQFNEDMLEEGQVWTEGVQSDEGAVTDQLIADAETVQCWTCGSTVRKEQIQSTVSRLRDHRREKLSDVNAVQDRLDELVEERKELAARRERREKLERRRSKLQDEIDERTERMSTLQEEREAATAAVTDLEAEIEAFESDEYEAVLALHREANELEFELERLEGDREEVSDEIATIEDRLGERGRLVDEREAVQAHVEELRTRIDRIETAAVDTFNEHMATVLDLLEYDNLERIWVERTGQSASDGRRTIDRASFELHVIRSTESGATYEDTVDHLSESEREVTGLVFALAGFLVHEVHETVPFMLLDSLEAVDADRIALLVDYLLEKTDYLVVALLEEDAAALDAEYERISGLA